MSDLKRRVKALEKAASKLNTGVFRTGPEIIAGIREVIGMMEPIVSASEDCLCIDAPWHEEDYDEDDPGQTFENPSNHSQYCPFYIQAYLQALADGRGLPE